MNRVGSEEFVDVIAFYFHKWNFYKVSVPRVLCAVNWLKHQVRAGNMGLF